MLTSTKTAYNTLTGAPRRHGSRERLGRALQPGGHELPKGRKGVATGLRFLRLWDTLARQGRRELRWRVDLHMVCARVQLARLSSMRGSRSTPTQNLTNVQQESVKGGTLVRGRACRTSHLLDHSLHKVPISLTPVRRPDPGRVGAYLRRHCSSSFTAPRGTRSCGCAPFPRWALHIA